jgi:hypothetical protein
MADTAKSFNCAFGNYVTGVHTAATAVYKIRLTNVEPVRTNTLAATFTAVTGGSYTDQTITLSWTEVSAGVWQLGDANSDVEFTPSGTAYSAFQYAVLFDDTPTSPLDPVIAYLDFGQEITALGVGQPFSVNAGSSGWIQFTNPSWT